MTVLLQAITMVKFYHQIKKRAPNQGLAPLQAFLTQKESLHCNLNQFGSHIRNGIQLAFQGFSIGSRTH